MSETLVDIQIDVLASVPDLRVVMLDLDAGQRVPWHRHTAIDDQFICMSGPMVINLREPGDAARLEAGEFYSVRANRPHEVMGEDGGPCKFAIVQGVGRYDYVPDEGSEA